MNFLGKLFQWKAFDFGEIYLRTIRIDPEETKMWVVFQVLEFIVKKDFYKYQQCLSAY